MKKTLGVLALALLAAGCASSASVDNDPVPLTQVPAADPRVSELETQLTELLERIDVLNHRIARLEEGAPAGPAQTVAATPQTAAPRNTRPAPQPEAPAAPATEPQREEAQPAAAPQRALVGAQIAEDYRQAIMLVGKGRHADARNVFQSVFEADPNGDLADNALFWIGETYFAAKDYNNAVRYYSRVVSDYGSQNKAPDALFKTAIAQERTGDLALAKRTLQQVIERYPYSTPASSAKAELDRIKF